MIKFQPSTEEGIIPGSVEGNGEHECIQLACDLRASFEAALGS